MKKWLYECLMSSDVRQHCWVDLDFIFYFQCGKKKSHLDYQLSLFMRFWDLVLLGFLQ